MLPPDGQSDRFLIAKETKCIGQRSGKFEFCYVFEIVSSIDSFASGCPIAESNCFLPRPLA